MQYPITTTDLAAARAAVASLMTETVTIKRPTNGTSASGATKRTLSAGVSSVCRKRDLLPSEQPNTDQLEPVKLTEFLFPYNADVRSDDVIVHTEGSFEVVGPPEKRSTLLQLRVLAKRAAA